MRSVAALVLSCILWPCAAALDAQHVAGRRGMRGAVLRPILTGCLEECGIEDQSCVTQCEVCVEQNACPGLLTNCSSCLEEAHSIKQESLKRGDLATDSGGPALEHEGIRQRFRSARLEAMDTTRRLREARDGVLQAQRGVEWAVEETREEVDRLEKTEDHLAETKEEAERWTERSKTKLEEMRDQRTQLREDVNRTLRQLRVANKDLLQSKMELAEAKDLAHAGAKVRKVIVTARVVTRLHWKLRKQSKEMRKAREAYKKQRHDSSWFQRGLQNEVQEVAQSVKKQAKMLDDAHEMERNSRRNLQTEKDEYREAAELRENLTDSAARLREELSSHPLPTYVPSEVLERQRQGG